MWLTLFVVPLDRLPTLGAAEAVFPLEWVWPVVGLGPRSPKLGARKLPVLLVCTLVVWL